MQENRPDRRSIRLFGLFPRKFLESYFQPLGSMADAQANCQENSFPPIGILVEQA